MEALKESHANDIEGRDSENNANMEELNAARAKIEELLKGGDYADEQLRIHIEELEDAVEVLKKGKTKWKDKYHELKEENDKACADRDSFKDNWEAEQQKTLMLSEQ